ncbi:hypothetical protein NKG94_22000 [Micromonospora sp. M12]
MLLIIALANVAGVVFAGEPGLDATPAGVERGLNFLLFALVHARGYPVFAVMFGYGLVQLARRQTSPAPHPGRSARCCCAATSGSSSSGSRMPRCCTTATSSAPTASSGS